MPPLKVRRRVLHWRPRLRGMDGGGDFSLLDGVDDIFIGLAVALVATVVLIVVTPVLLIAGELLLLLVLATAGMLGRILFRQPWTVEAVHAESGRVVQEWRVRGFRRAGEVAAAIQALADAGRPLPPPGDGSEALAAAPDEPSWPTA